MTEEIRLMGIAKRTRIFPSEVLREIVTRYSQGEGVRTLARIHDCSGKCISRILRQAKIEPHSPKEQCGTGAGELSGNRFLLFKQGADRRNLEFSITVEYAWNLFLEQNRRCRFTGRLIAFGIQSRLSKNRTENTASLDRIDSSKGYVVGNVQWLHKDVNLAKQSLTEKEFIALCDEVSSHAKRN